MIKKILDYYYLALYRGFENIQGKGRFFSYNVTWIMSLTIMFNIISLIALFCHNMLKPFISWLVFGIVGIIFMNILDAIYNKKRREKLVARYENESTESSRSGAAWVWVYEIFSVAFLIFSISMIE